jgi:hypothetical protein
MKSNRTLLEKADLSLGDLTTDGGLLERAQANRFIKLLIKKSVLLPLVNTIPMNSPKRLLETIRFAGRVLKPASPGVALPLGDRVKPDLTKPELDAKEYKAEVRLNDSVLEDNIERGTLRNTVMQALGDAVSRDVEHVVWNGDTASADPLLATQDGVRKLITSNLHPHGGGVTNATLWNAMLKSMPSEFLLRNRLWFLTSINSEIDWRNSVAARQTRAGDASLTNDRVENHQGVKILSIPEAPENLGGGSDETEVVLTDPQNIAVGFQRQIRMETARDISAGELIVVVTLRMAVQLVHEPATVKATGVVVA